MRAGAYNNNVMVFQTPGYVAILNEMGRLARLIPITNIAKPSFGQLTGVSRAHWEGRRWSSRRLSSARRAGGPAVLIHTIQATSSPW